MSKTAQKGLCLLAFGLMLGIAGAQATEPEDGADSPRFHEDRLILKLREGVSAGPLPVRALPRGLPGLDRWRGRHRIHDGFRLVRDHGRPVRDVGLFRKVGLDRVYVLRLPSPDSSRVRDLIRELRELPWVEYAEPDYLYEPLDTVPDDALYPHQWAHDNTGQNGGTPDADMDSPEGWDFGTGNPSAIVAVLDSGVDSDHPDLVDNLLAGFDLTDSPLGIEDDYGHGTQVAGNAAARGDNSVGVAGICWTCSILPIKVFNNDVFISTEELANAVVLAADNGADAITMSFGGASWSQTFRDSLAYANGVGALAFGAAGNTGIYAAVTPAAFPEVVSVAGSTNEDLHYGDYGDHAELAAPTVVLTTDETGGYSDFTGTSASTPFAAGLATLLRATDPTLHVQELRQLLRLGAEDQVADPGQDTPGWDPYMGYGRINVDRTMSSIDGPWVAMDRPHYICAGEVAVDVKDESAGGSVVVTLTGSVSGDVETLTGFPVTAHGYFRGTIPLSWAGVDGPAVSGDGVLDVGDGETILASYDTLTASSFAECAKRVCVKDPPLPPIAGDCDADGVADPGEIWQLEVRLRNVQTEQALGAVTTLTASSDSVEFFDDTQSYGDINPRNITGLRVFSFRVKPDSPANELITFTFTNSGPGWTSNDPGCVDAGHDNTVEIRGNRDNLMPDTWPAHPPSGLIGYGENCPGEFNLDWDGVAGAVSYEVFRSEISCEDAESASIQYGSTPTPGYTDTSAVEGVQYYYAVQAIEPGTGCVSERSCIPGGCICSGPADPAGLTAALDGDDVVLTWDDPGIPDLAWNVYRDSMPVPAIWSSPLQTGVTDTDPVAPGIQYVDGGAVAAGSPLFYLVTAVNACSESPLFDGDGDGFPQGSDNCPDDWNPDQADLDADGVGDACDNCTSGWNPDQADLDGDGLGDTCDPDDDADGWPDLVDNCPLNGNPLQGDADQDGVGDDCDNCPQDENPGQHDLDLDGAGDACDDDDDDDDVADAEDNCPSIFNPGQDDGDVDGTGDACDPCPLNPNPFCEPCPDAVLTDPDGDYVCDLEIPMIQEGSVATYLANSTDPGYEEPLEWVEESFGPTGWTPFLYGIGYETASVPPNAHDLISTPVPSGTRSVYTRAGLTITDMNDVLGVRVGADYDDGYAVWLNGVELFRSPEMPAGDPAWDQTLNASSESSNQSDPVYEPLIDVSATALGVLHHGLNVAAIGVWNYSSSSTDLVLVPLVSIISRADNCPYHANTDQADGDGDGVGTVCDNCPSTPNPDQADDDGDGIGDACDT